jgi:hexosaminidase
MTPTILPIPAACRFTGAAPFKLNARTPVVALSPNPALRRAAAQLAGRLGLEVAGAARPRAITLRLDPALKKSLGAEGYRLSSRASGVAVRAATAQGVFYGTQSLRQLLPPETERLGAGAAAGLAVPALEITDRPRFGWRGAMLDPSRHFLSVAETKRFLDAMALHKLNVLHWHLVDDQGWRLEIKKYPRLTEVGAWRAESPVYGNRDAGDGTPYGGYYTQAQAREIVAYAAERFITVVPEIELPGHAAAAIAAYPRLGNRDVPGYAPRVAARWGIHPYIYAPDGPVFTFLADVLAEVAALFPSRYIHIGGDEAVKDQWRQSAFAQKVIRREGLKDEHGLQSWFIRRVERILARHGRRLIGWDEINEGGLSPTATMMVWRDVKWAEFAIARGNDVVMAPVTHCYLDHYQADPEAGGEPEAIGGHNPLENVYAFEPLPPGLKPAQARHVLGVQGNLWSEYLPHARQMEYMAFPRLSALAEVGWSPPERKDWEDFRARLGPLLRRLELLGVNFRAPQGAAGNTG